MKAILVLLYYLTPIFLLIWTKVKTDIKIYRVLILSFLPLFLVAILFFIFDIADNGNLLSSLEIIYMVIFFGYMLFYPVLVTSALLVKFLQNGGNDIYLSAILGSIFATVFFVSIAIFLGDIDTLFIPLVVFASGFISVFIENWIFQNLKKRISQ